MTYPHSHNLSVSSSRTNSRSENRRSSSHDAVDSEQIILNSLAGNGNGRREHEDEEALLEKDKLDHVPRPPSRPSFVVASFWIAVNTLATIGIVGVIYRGV
jgi:solute carrier family 35, member E3